VLIISKTYTNMIINIIIVIYNDVITLTYKIMKIILIIQIISG